MELELGAAASSVVFVSGRFDNTQKSLNKLKQSRHKLLLNYSVASQSLALKKSARMSNWRIKSSFWPPIESRLPRHGSCGRPRAFGLASTWQVACTLVPRSLVTFLKLRFLHTQNLLNITLVATDVHHDSMEVCMWC